MYLRSSKWNYTNRRKRSSPWRILVLAVLVGVMVMINQVVVPNTQPLFIPTPTATRSPQSFVTEAENLAASGKLAQSIEAYTQAIQADPKTPANFIALARLQMFTGQYTEAQSNAENALILSPNNALALAVRGWALGFQGNYLEAEAAINRALEIEPNNAIAYAYLAEVIALQIQAGKDTLASKEKMITASRQAVDYGPNLLETHRARGLVLELTSNYQEAAVEFEKAVAQNPNIADLHLALGRNYRALEQYDRAMEEFNRANALNPSDPLPLIYISRTFFTVGEFAKAIQAAQQAISITPSDPFLYGNLGSIYYRNRQYPEAIQTLRMAIRGGTAETGETVNGLPLDYGRVAEYYYTYGLAAARAGECSEALQISRLLLDGVPNDETAVYNANEMVNICREAANSPLPTGTPDAEGTALPESDGTAQPEGEMTPTPAS